MNAYVVITPPSITEDQFENKFEFSSTYCHFHPFFVLFWASQKIHLAHTSMSQGEEIKGIKFPEENR
jgi:hypothetical protein